LLSAGVGRGGIAVPNGGVMVVGEGIAGIQALPGLPIQGSGRCLVQAISAIGGESAPHPAREASHRRNDKEASHRRNDKEANDHG